MKVSELIDALAQIAPDVEVAVMGGIITGLTVLDSSMVVLDLEFA